MNSIAKILTLVGLSSLVLLFPFPIMEERAITLLEADAIAQENSASLKRSRSRLIGKSDRKLFLWLSLRNRIAKLKQLIFLILRVK